MGMELAFQMTDALPNEYGMNVVKGILWIVFEVILSLSPFWYPADHAPVQTAKRRGENRARILEAFESIPETILTINFSCSLLKPTAEDEKLRQDFHRELVKRMPELIDILLGRAPWFQRVKGYMTLKVSETAKIGEILSEWNQYITTLKNRVMQMRDRLQSEIAYHSAEAHQMGVQTYNKLGTFDSRFDEIQSIIVGLGPAIIAQMQQEFGKRLQQLERSVQARDGKFDFTANYPVGFDINSPQNNPDLERQEYDFAGSQLYTQPTHGESYAIITQLELLGLLRVGPSTALEDLEFILQQSNRTTELSLQQVWWLNRMDEFITWYREPCSSLLLVDGHLDTTPSDRISPLSIFDASFVLNLVQSPSRITFFFFAGLVDGEDEEKDANINDPCGLIRSLISQLLSHESLPQPDLRFLTQEWIEQCEMNNIKALCDLFKCLVFQVPADMQVFCILDGLVVYECEPLWRDEIDYMATLFQHMTLKTGFNGIPVVKTLFTFANRSLQISDRVDMYPDIWKHATLAAGHIDVMPLMI
ncbi:hypothetical protein TSTA_052730 [Talaromyces stipitatus ATCC 10500]|uniref:Nephrocystin 3-like N-terminal domain-containing protein n=1 Tax=Talaromyces stipitatus (strain ATCC 10500 / CBS 375.48 / QM 6759 / NRRL 1006) TaxID=441959 RepID=B8MPU4_TALSN|nr:uncharacterized protein TSTA_052730 [Talaromyces stipitatus ATCC 10500]EED12752.1 hypothetical protein TSTA_052730 [Talaromyces stipitatus ATCC 10500]